DLRPVLVEPVIVACDRARADIRSLSDGGVADIAQMVDLGARPELSRLQFHEIADANAGTELCPRPQPGKGAYRRAAFDIGAFDVAEGFDRHARLDHRSRTEKDVRLNHDIVPNDGIVAESHRLRGKERGSAFHGLKP